jgi:hypothetical protein
MYRMLFGTRHHSDQPHCRTSRTLNLHESQIMVRKCEEGFRHTAITKATARADPAVFVLDSAAGSIQKWTTESLREALKRESRIGIGQELTIAAYREIAIGISWRFLRGTTAFKTDNGEEGQEAWNQEDMASIIADLQAGHTPHVAGMIYAGGLMEMVGAVADKRMQFRMSSMDWHQFLGFETLQACKKRERAPFEEEADEARFDRWARMQDMDMTARLKQMVGDICRP